MKITNLKHKYTPASDGYGDDIASLEVSADTELGRLVLRQEASDVRHSDGLDFSLSLDEKELDVELPDFGLTGATKGSRAAERMEEDLQKNLPKILSEWLDAIKENEEEGK
jgi:hypothetical protein